MFPKNKINIVFRLLCLLSFIAVIILIKSITTLIVLFLVYCFLAISERSFRDIEFIILSLLLLLVCYLFNNYILFRAVLLIEYIFYFIDTSYYIEDDEEVQISQNEYVRFAKVKKKKKKGSSNIAAIYLTVHLVLLFLAIMVG